jgi:hypothetical protein
MRLRLRLPTMLGGALLSAAADRRVDTRRRSAARVADMTGDRRHAGLIRRGLPVVLAVAVAAGAWVALASGAGSSDSGAAAPTTTAAPGNLYVVDATSGRAVKTAEATWRLKLRDTSVLWFSDRPTRRSGLQRTSRFVAAWPATFHGAPPNAALLLPSGSAAARPIAVELTKPRYDRDSGVVSFTLRPEVATKHALSASLSRLEPTERARARRIVLFIDDGAPLPPAPPSQPPSVIAAAALAEGQTAIAELQALAASGDPQVAALAVSNLRVLAENAQPVP